MTTQKSKQKNYRGHNIGKDYVGGDQINSLIGKIIGDNNVTNIHYIATSKFRLTEEDEKKFSSFIPDNKVSEFRNLIERIEFSYELYDFDIALGFIDEANKIYHNHPILLILSGLCEYAVLDKLEVVKHPYLIIKSVKLFEKARVVHQELGEYRGWNHGVASHFKEILEDNIEIIKNHKNWYDSTNKQVQYYKAIAKHLIHFENCFRISGDIEYLKEFISHLTGNEGYPWFNISDNKLVEDLGVDIFDNGAEGMIVYLNSMVVKEDPNYVVPETKYGSYFDTPGNRGAVGSSKQRVRIISISLLIFAIMIGVVFLFFANMPLVVKILLLLYPLLIWSLSHQFNGNLSAFQKISKLIYDRIK